VFLADSKPVMFWICDQNAMRLIGCLLRLQGCACVRDNERSWFSWWKMAMGLLARRGIQSFLSEG
jgi:hypothetical protein